MCSKVRTTGGVRSAANSCRVSVASRITCVCTRASSTRARSARNAWVSTTSVRRGVVFSCVVAVRLTVAVVPTGESERLQKKKQKDKISTSESYCQQFQKSNTGLLTARLVDAQGFTSHVSVLFSCAIRMQLSLCDCRHGAEFDVSHERAHGELQVPLRAVRPRLQQAARTQEPLGSRTS